MGGGSMMTAARTAALGGLRLVVPRGPWMPAANVPAGAAPMTAAMASANAQVDVVEAPRASWEFEDWELAGGKEEELFDALRPSSRLVFGPAPTLEEAKEATSDLKDAVERAYLSPAASGGAVHAGSTQSSPRRMLNSETEVCVDSVNAVLPAMPKHVVQAFSLLQGSPEAQDVVASIASDENVWNAVMKNEKVVAFYKSQCATLPPIAAESNVSDNENEALDESSSRSETPFVETSSGSPSEGLQNLFMAYVDTVKTKVSEMVNNLSNFFQDLMGSTASVRSSTDARDGTADIYGNIAVGSSFLALAIAAILVILVKRGA